MRQQRGSVAPRPMRWLPHAARSAPARSERLHAVLTALLVAHVPALAAVGVAPVAVAALAPLAAVGAGVGGAGVAARSVATAGGLASASVLLLWLFGEGSIGHLHVAVVLAIVPAYRNWRATVVAASVAAAGYGLWAGTLAAAGVAPAALLAPPVLVAAVGAASLMCWLAVARAEQRVDELRGSLRVQEGVLAQRVEDVEELKAQLIASVSHEFRTPLTSLTGYARTLAARIDELPPAAVDRCVSGIDQHATRLARLVHNLLAADGDIAADPLAVVDIGVVACRAADEAVETYGGRVGIALDVPANLRARVDVALARQIVGNLLDNAVRYAPEGSLVRVTGRLDGCAVTLEVTNEACALDAARLEGLFEPFAGVGDAAEGLHLGLHVARRAADASGGGLTARLAHGLLSMRLELPATAPVSTTPGAAPGAA